LVNLARHIEVDAESALRVTIDKFSRRFAHVEQRVLERHGGWTAPRTKEADEPVALPLATLDVYWEEAKASEAAKKGSEANANREADS